MGALTHRPASLARTIQPLVSGPPAPVVPAANVLASLIDLRGSVDLADVLSQRGRSRLPRIDDVAFARGLDARVQLAAIEADVALRLVAPFSDRPRLPDAEAMHVALAKGQSLGAFDKALHLAALVAPFRDRLLSLVGRVRDQVAEVRAMLADDVSAASPEAARVEALDRALTAATNEGVTRLFARLAAAIEQSALRDVTQAAKALPPQAGVEHLSPWFVEGGWARAHIDRIDAVTRAVLAHEHSVLDALLARASRVYL